MYSIASSYASWRKSRLVNTRPLDKTAFYCGAGFAFRAISDMIARGQTPEQVGETIMAIGLEATEFMLTLTESVGEN